MRHFRWAAVFLVCLALSAGIASAAEPKKPPPVTGTPGHGGPTELCVNAKGEVGPCDDASSMGRSSAPAEAPGAAEERRRREAERERIERERQMREMERERRERWEDMRGRGRPR